jgi:hypothetical protein
VQALEQLPAVGETDRAARGAIEAEMVSSSSVT